VDSYEDPRWLTKFSRNERGELCAGSLVLMANICKSPRSREFPTLKPQKNVFASLDEFIEHHRKGHIHSWDDNEDLRGRSAWEAYKRTPFSAAAYLEDMDKKRVAGTTRLIAEEEE